jgi:purine catabolism regulator
MARYVTGQNERVPVQIRNLLDVELFDVRLIAGLKGIDNVVLWAHVSELEDPTPALGPNELLMINGYSMPAQAQEQVEYIRKLHRAGLAGLMVPDHHPMYPEKPLADEALAEADAHSFPILLASGLKTRYADITRHVATANWSSQAAEVFELSRLYGVVSQIDTTLDEQLANIAFIIHANICIEDGLSGGTLASSGDVSSNEKTIPRRIPLDGKFNAILVINESQDSPVSAFLLVHLKRILQLSADSLLQNLRQRELLGARVMDSLLAGRTPESLSQVVDPNDLNNGFHLVAFHLDELATVSRTLSIAKLPAISGKSNKHAFSLVPAASLEHARRVLGNLQIRAGVSSKFNFIIDVAAAASEAERALSTNPGSASNWLTLEGTELSVLTRSLKEANEIIETVFGTLAENSSKMEILRETLFVFLDSDRHWESTINKLSIHRQTLAYRLRRISDETGRNFRNTEDLSALWIASRAWKTIYGRG